MDLDFTISGNPSAAFAVDAVIIDEIVRRHGLIPCHGCAGARCALCHNTGLEHARQYINEMLFKPTNINVPMAKSDEMATIHVIPGSKIGHKEYGPLESDIMIIGEEIDDVSASAGHHYHVSPHGKFGTTGSVLKDVFDNAGIKEDVYSTFYYTNCLKFTPPGRITGAIPAQYYRYVRFMLSLEIMAVKPKVILVMGAQAVKMLMGTKAKISNMEGTVLRLSEITQLGDPLPLHDTATSGAFVICTPSTNMLLFNSFRIADSVIDFNKALSIRENGVTDKQAKKDYRYIDNLKDLKLMAKELRDANIDLLAVDCEWGGRDHSWGYLRSIQGSWGSHTAFVVTFYHDDKSNTELAHPLSPNGRQYNAHYNAEALKILNSIFNSGSMRLIGHAIRADLIWMVQQLGMVGVQDRAYFDTMLAHHVYNDTLPHDLSYMSSKMSDLGIYDTDLENWKTANKINEKILEMESYGMIPDSILLPYSAKDVDATFQIYEVMREFIDNDADAKSLFYTIVMPATAPILEMEMSGLRVDVEALVKLIGQYTEAERLIREKLVQLVGDSYFNPGSPTQVVKLLFAPPEFDANDDLVKFGLRPEVTTGNNPPTWDDIENEEDYQHDKDYISQKSFKPSTGMETLEALLGGVETDYPESVKATYDVDLNPKDIARVKEVLRALLDFKLVDQMKKNFTSPPNEAGEYRQGLMQYLKPDGCIATRLSQMTSTGRYACVAKWTPVVTKRGEIPISSVIVGDEVISHKRRWCEVIDTQIKGFDDMYDVTFTNGQTITCTSEHRFFVKKGTITVAELIDIGVKNKKARDVVFPSTYKKDLRVASIRYRGKLEVYDITVDDDHSYLSCGLFSHNSSEPNLQNLTKHGEKDVIAATARALGIDISEISSLRSVFIPRPGMVFIEADFASAEVFTLGYLSGDKLLMEDATKDIHSRNAVALLGAPKYKGYDEGKKPDGDWKEKYSTLRAASKELSFGIPYGKGGKSMARSITLKSGMICTARQGEEYINAWKKKYAKAWEFLDQCGKDAVTKWRVRSPFGRYRNFPQTDNNKKLAAYKREAYNYPIQGTVGELLTKSLIESYDYRKKPENDIYKTLLVIHDANLAECSLEDIKEVKEALRLCMCDRAVIPGTNYRLEIDVEFSFRWCVKLTKRQKELIEEILN